VYNAAFVSRNAFILLIAAGLTFFLGLGRGAIGDSDEAFYAEAAREMTESGDWLTPYYNYELRFQKPILYYWLAAGAYRTGGLGEAEARVPSAAAGLGLVLLTWLCARRWYSEDVGLIAGLIAATNYGYFSMARMALPDLPLAAFVVAASWTGLESLRAARAKDAAAARWWLFASGVACGLGVLMKGPVGIILPGLVVAGALAIPERGARGWPWRTSDLALAAAAFLIVAAPWYAAMAREHGLGYLHHFFVGENLDRFATDRYNTPRPLWFYVPIVAGGLLPWTPFVAPWLTGLADFVRHRRRPTPRAWLLVWWAVAPLLFYSFSIGKQPRYVLPVLPPLAVLLAATIQGRVEGALGGNVVNRRTLAWCATFSALILLVLGGLLHRGQPLLFALSPTTGLIATAVVIVAGVALLAAGWAGRPTWIPFGVAAASAASLLAVHYSIYSVAGMEPVQKLAAVYRQHWAEGVRSGTYRVFVRNLVFYTGVKQTDLNSLEELAEFLSSEDRVLAVATADDLERLHAQSGLQPRRLEQVTYFNAAGLRMRTLLHPDPGKDLETVWLVTNR
jgi:4-amino-4-deoxy-L-arabinose transferase-like glycosyltransferase